MRRREFIFAFSSACLAGPAFGDDARRLGVLTSTTEFDPEGQARVNALREGLLALGWTEGRNLKIDYRWGAGSIDRARAGAAELVALKPDVIFAAPTSSLEAVRSETHTIPIVFAQVADPIKEGFVARLDHPGGNITGFTQFEFPLAAKWIELLKQITPSMKWVAIIYDPANANWHNYLPIIEKAAGSGGIDARAYAIRSKDDVTSLIARIAAEPNGGLIPLPGPLTVVDRISSSRRRRNIACPIFTPSVTTLTAVGSSLMVWTITISIGEQRPMWIVY